MTSYLPGLQPTVQVPVIRGHFGHRVATYSAVLSVQDIYSLLRHDPRSSEWKHLDPDLRELYASVQRNTSGKRIAALKNYIDSRFVGDNAIAGGFPAVSIAFKEYSRFEPINGDESSPLGVLHVVVTQQNRGMIIDGLGRVTAALSLLDEANDPKTDQISRRRALERLESFRLPCTIFVPRQEKTAFSLADFQQLFHDFNFKSTPISRSHAIAIDHSDIFISMTRIIAKQAVIAKNGGMKVGLASPVETRGRKPKNALPVLPPLVSQKDLLLFVRAATDGEELAQKPSRETGTNARFDKMDDLAVDLAEFLSDFADAMGPERFLDSSSLHRTAKGWYAIGAIYHDARFRLDRPDMTAVARALANRIDWHADASTWRGIVELLPATTKSRTGYRFVSTGYTPHAEMTKAIRRELGFDALLVERGIDN